MSKQRIIRDEIWNDDWFFSLDASHKLVWLFLLTNDRNNVAGVYKLNRGWAAKTLGMEIEQFDGIIDDFEGAKKVFTHQSLILLTNHYKHQSKSPKIKAGIKRILDELSEEDKRVLIGYDRLCIEYRTLLYSTLPNSTLPNDVDTSGLDEFFDKPKFTDTDMELAQLLADRIKGNNPDWQMRGNMETWAEHIEKLRRIDGRTPEQIRYMINWTQSDEFWQSNILSTAKLREKFNDLIPKVKQKAVQYHQQQVKNSKPKMV